MIRHGKYMYCVIEENGATAFGPIGVGGRGDHLAMVTYRGLSTVVSNSPIQEYRVTRENTMAHQQAIETVMRDQPVLPIRFSTIAESEEEIVEKVLKPRYGEFQELLAWIRDKKELGLKVYWREMKAVLNEVAEKNEGIRAFKQEIQKKPAHKAYYDQIEIGKMIESALNLKREKERDYLTEPLKKLAEDTKVHVTYIPELVVSAAFLVKKTAEPGFDEAVNRIEEECPDRYRITYVGNAPPVNFVNIVITWDRKDMPPEAPRDEVKQSQSAETHPAGSGVRPRDGKEGRNVSP